MSCVLVSPYGPDGACLLQVDALDAEEADRLLEFVLGLDFSR